MRRWTAVGAVLVSVAAMTSYVETASAALPGLVRVSVTTEFNSLGFKTAVARCPDNKLVIGAGGAATGDLDAVLLLSQVSPGPPFHLQLPDVTNEVAVSAFENPNGGTNIDWAVTAIAVCASRTGLGLERVLASTPYDSFSPKEAVTPACPDGKRVVGTGGTVSREFPAPPSPTPIPGQPDAFIDEIRPVGALPFRQVRVKAFEPPGGVTARWSLTAIAICANPLPGLEVVSARSVENSRPSRAATAFCPDDKVVIDAGGGRVPSQAFGEIAMRGLFIDPIEGEGIDNVTVTAAEHTGTASNWAIDAFAVCAFP